MTETVTVPGPHSGGPALPPWLERTRRVLAVIGGIEMVLAVTALSVVVVLSGAQAILRYTIGASLWWSQEVAQLTILVAYFFGVSYVFKARQYILIEFVSAQFSMRVQLIFYIFAQVMTIVFALTTVVLIWRFAPLLMNMVTPTLRLPDLIRALPLGIASVMLALTSLYYLAFGIWALSRGITGSSLYEVEARALVATMAAAEE